MFDRASDLIVYDTEKNRVTTSPRIVTADLENMPIWSPDENYLYFCSALRLQRGHAADSVRYSLMRICYDAQVVYGGSGYGSLCSGDGAEYFMAAYFSRRPVYPVLHVGLWLLLNSQSVK